jgi:hypothetical protein
MEADKICMDDAKIRVKKGNNREIIGNYLVDFGDDEGLAASATIILIEGVEYRLDELVDKLKNELSAICNIEICSCGAGGENFILVEAIDQGTNAGNFYYWIVSTLQALMYR